MNELEKAFTTTTGSAELAPVTITGKKEQPGAFKVRIKGPGPSGELESVYLQASPLLSEAGSAMYEGYAITHLPSEILAYKFSSSRKFQIQGRLVSRNKNEAQQNAKYLDLIRSWRQPGFGTTGATPPVVYLYGYNNNNIYGVQCVIKSYSFGFPDDVDFIYDSSVPMPVIGQLTIELDEAYSAEQITAGAWKVDIAEDGSFEDGESLQYAGGDSLSPTLGIALGKKSQKTRSLADIFSNPASTPSSTQLKDDVSKVGSVGKNPLINGTSPSDLIAKASQAITSILPQTSVKSSDSFGRSGDLPPPSLITG